MEDGRSTFVAPILEPMLRRSTHRAFANGIGHVGIAREIVVAINAYRDRDAVFEEAVLDKMVRGAL